MHYINYYNSPLGRILLAADDEGLTGLWFEGQKYYALNLDKNNFERETLIIKEAKNWLDLYFSGIIPNFTPKLNPIGTEFQKVVWELLTEIPYGKTNTYKEIAQKTALKRGLKRMSAQAAGGAVGHNPISIIIPCHRVIGTNKSLTGYAGGIDIKIKLLELEGCNIQEFIMPKIS